MAKYKSIVTTEAGLALIENAAYMGGSIQFTALKTGNGTYDDTENLAAATDLKNVCQTFGVGSVTNKNGNVIVRAVIDNVNLEAGYVMTEIGLYASNPGSGEDILYAIILAESGCEDYVPSYADVPTSITFEAFFELTESSEAVTFTVDLKEDVYVSAKSFNEHLEDKGVHVTPEEKEAWNKKADDEHSHTAEQVGLGNVSNVTTNDQTPTYAVPSEIAALSSGEKLSVAFGKIAKAISSLISHIADATLHHFHNNKSVLDNTTASYTAEEQTKLSGIASGANAYTHPNSGVTAGTYRSVTVNAAGHVTGGSNPTLTVAQGGTGATTAAAARTNLGITPANIGAAAASHAHTASQITGTVPVTISTSQPSSGLWVVP